MSPHLIVKARLCVLKRFGEKEGGINDTREHHRQNRNPLSETPILKPCFQELHTKGDVASFGPACRVNRRMEWGYVYPFQKKAGELVPDFVTMNFAFLHIVMIVDIQWLDPFLP